MSNDLQVGWAYADITPYGKKVSLSGQYYERITDEVDLPLMAAVLMIKHGDRSLTWITCDIVGITSRLLADVKKSVAEIGVDCGKLIMNAIHTHNAPYVQYGHVFGRSGYFKDKPGIMSDEEYHAFIVEKIAEAVVKAESKLKSRMTLEKGVSNIRTGCCRRGILKNGDGVMYIDTSRPDFQKMEGPDGGPVPVIALKDSKGALNGVIACIPCTSQVLEHQFVISSDYTGRLRNMFRDRFGDDFIFLPLISPAGDLSPRNLVTKDDGLGDMYSPLGADKFAENIFNGILETIKSSLEAMDSAAPILKSKKIELPGWIPSEDDYKWAKEIMKTDEVTYDIEDYVQKGVEPYYKQPLALEKKAESIIVKFEQSDYYKSVSIEITAVRIGDFTLVTNPFELFIEYGNRITAGVKAASVWPVQLVNGYEGYFPTPEAVKAGGYSAYIQSVRVQPETAGDILVEESISLVNSLYE